MIHKTHPHAHSLEDTEDAEQTKSKPGPMVSRFSLRSLRSLRETLFVFALTKSVLSVSSVVRSFVSPIKKGATKAPF